MTSDSTTTETPTTELPPFVLSSFPIPSTNLLSLVHKSEIVARANQFLVEYDPSLNSVQYADPSIVDFNFVLCLAENLSNKPVMPTKPKANNNDGNTDNNDNSDSKPKPKQTLRKKRRNPFLGPFVAGSHVCDIPNTHFRLILNKFPVLPHHMLTISKEFKEQTQALIEPDFDVIAGMLASLQHRNNDNDSGSAGHNVLCFFNSGMASGASMPHRHMHFIPVSNTIALNEAVMKQIAENANANANENENENEHSNNNVFMLEAFDFLHGIIINNHAATTTTTATTTQPQMNGNSLFAMYQQLLAYFANAGDIRHMSYNMIITADLMFIVPRKAPAFIFQSESATQQNVKFAINALPFAGYIFFNTVEHRELFNAYTSGQKNDSNNGNNKAGRISDILKFCTYPSTTESGINNASKESFYAYNAQ